MLNRATRVSSSSGQSWWYTPVETDRRTGGETRHRRPADSSRTGRDSSQAFELARRGESSHTGETVVMDRRTGRETRPDSWKGGDSRLSLKSCGTAATGPYLLIGRKLLYGRHCLTDETFCGCQLTGSSTRMILSVIITNCVRNFTFGIIVV